MVDIPRSLILLHIMSKAVNLKVWWIFSTRRAHAKSLILTSYRVYMLLRQRIMPKWVSTALSLRTTQKSIMCLHTVRLYIQSDHNHNGMYDERQSTTTNSIDWICWQGYVPSSTGRLSTPSEWILSPRKPYSADFTGSNFAYTRFIMLSVEWKRMSGELPIVDQNLVHFSTGYS